MKHFLKQIPIPISGLMLGLFSIVKLLIDLDQQLKSIIFFSLGLTIWGLIVLKVIFAFNNVIEQMKNPVVASVAPTFTMGTMLFSSILLPYMSAFKYLWFAALALQILLVCYFIKKFILTRSFTLQSVLPSWFIVFVGIGVAPVTLGDIYPEFTQVIFWFAVGCYTFLLPTVLTRLIKYSLIDMVKPLFVILSAPASLLSVGYLQAFHNHLEILLYGLFTLSQLFYIIVLTQLPRLLSLPFYPSYAAFTFPLVISAIAMDRMYVHTGYSILHVISYVELLIGVLVVLYVYIRYTDFLSKTVQTVNISPNKI